MFADAINQDGPNQYEQNLVFSVLKYIETHYKNGSLTEAAKELGQPAYSISRLLKKHTKFNFKELLQQRKLQQAAYLLSQTPLTVEAVMKNIGYDNSSYFYPFPMNKSAMDVMMNAPSSVEQRQLDEVHIRLKEEEKPEELYAVADEVILIGQNGQRVLIFQCIHTALRHGKRIMTEWKSTVRTSRICVST